jgi:hypothetical protein
MLFRKSGSMNKENAFIVFLPTSQKTNSAVINPFPWTTVVLSVYSQVSVSHNCHLVSLLPIQGVRFGHLDVLTNFLTYLIIKFLICYNNNNNNNNKLFGE